MKKTIGIILSIVFVLALGFSITWAVINANKLKNAMSGTGLYTKEDLNNSYQDGYDTALKNKDEYDKLIKQYRDTITENESTILILRDSVNSLTSKNEEDIKTISELRVNVENLNVTIITLTDSNNSNNLLIIELNKTIKNLENVESDNEELNTQVTELKNLVTSLRGINSENIVTINGLNAQIINLNADVLRLQAQVLENNGNVAVLNNKIAELEQNVSYYKKLLEAYQNENRVIATFKFNNTIYNVQVIDKNNKVTVADPTSTDFVVFNGWLLNGTAVDLSTYVVTADTTFTADITKYFNVKFNVDNVIVGTEKVIQNGKISDYENPTKVGHTFKGWSLNGEIIDMSNFSIIENITVTAVFEINSYVVQFVDFDDTVISIQNVNHGSYAIAAAEPTRVGYTFKGWHVDPTATAITQATTFKATYEINSYNVVFKNYDDTILKTDEVNYNNFAAAPTAPVREDFTFKGWSIDGKNLVDLTTYTITTNTTFVALYESNLPITFKNSTKLTESNIGNGRPIIIYNTYYEKWESLTVKILLEKDCLNSGSGGLFNPTINLTKVNNSQSTIVSTNYGNITVTLTYDKFGLKITFDYSKANIDEEWIQSYTIATNDLSIVYFE